MTLNQIKTPLIIIDILGKLYQRRTVIILIRLYLVDKIFKLDETVLRLVEESGYKREFVLKSLLNNDLNYAIASYFLFLNSKIE